MESLLLHTEGDNPCNGLAMIYHGPLGHSRMESKYAEQPKLGPPSNYSPVKCDHCGQYITPWSLTVAESYQ